MAIDWITAFPKVLEGVIIVGHLMQDEYTTYSSASGARICINEQMQASQFADVAWLAEKMQALAGEKSKLSTSL